MLKSNDLNKFISYITKVCEFKIILTYSNNIQSPNEKNLYFSSTAVLYKCIVLLRPAKADTSIISVDLGKWKLVISASTTLNSYGGYINIDVS